MRWGGGKLESGPEERESSAHTQHARGRVRAPVFMRAHVPTCVCASTRGLPIRFLYVSDYTRHESFSAPSLASRDGSSCHVLESHAWHTSASNITAIL